MSKSRIEKSDFSHIHDWIFDLDNTLYPRRCDLFSQIDVKMTEFVADLTGLERTQARILQKQYYKDHGTTLNGLMINHQIDPQDFLDHVHDIDYSPIDHDPDLRVMLDALPGRKFIFTNGDVPHAERTMEALGITGLFEGIFDIVAADLIPKPAQEPYHKFVETYDIKPDNAIMFEDMPRNLVVPKSLGMRTVLMADHLFDNSGVEAFEKHDPDTLHLENHIDHVTSDMTTFLKAIS